MVGTIFPDVDGAMDSVYSSSSLSALLGKGGAVPARKSEARFDRGEREASGSSPLRNRDS